MSCDTCYSQLKPIPIPHYASYDTAIIVNYHILHDNTIIENHGIICFLSSLHKNTCFYEYIHFSIAQKNQMSCMYYLTIASQSFNIWYFCKSVLRNI